MIVAFDNSAIMTVFDELGHGTFCPASTVQRYVAVNYSVERIKKTKQLKSAFCNFT